MMKEKITLRQLIFMYLFISVSPIVKQIPNSVASVAGSSSYVSCIFSMVVIFVLVGVMLSILKGFPESNIYEIMIHICGKFLAKLIVLLYFLWFIVSAVFKFCSYSFMLQSTLMPALKTGFLFITMLLLVVYALSKGTKTVLRFSEVVFLPLMFFVLLLIIFAIIKIDFTNLLPVSVYQLNSNMIASINVFSIGGGIILILFFSNQMWENLTYETLKKKLILSVCAFTLIAITICIIAIGICGAGIVAKLSYPLFTAFKSVSILNAFERLESLITLVCMFSDFVAICVFSILAVKCLAWIFGENKILCYQIFLGILAVVMIILLLNATQFQMQYYYSTILIYCNILFEYLIPFALFVLYILEKLFRYMTNKSTA